MRKLHPLLAHGARIFVVSLVLAGVMYTPPVRAVETLAPIIGIVDMQQVLREAKAAVSIRNAVEKKRKALDAALQKKVAGLKAEEEKLRKQKAVLSAEAFQDKRAKLKRQVEDLRRASAQQADSLKRIFNAEMRKLRNQLNKSVVEVMKETNLNMVLPRATVLVFDERMNVTKNVLTKIDGTISTVKVDFSALNAK